MDWWGEQGNSPDVQVALLLFSSSVMSDSLWPHGLQHIRLSCPSPSPGACSNSCPSCQRCHPTISPSVIPFSSCLQSFPASGSFLMCRLFASHGQSIGHPWGTSIQLLQSGNIWRFFLGENWLKFLKNREKEGVLKSTDLLQSLSKYQRHFSQN